MAFTVNPGVIVPWIIVQSAYLFKIWLARNALVSYIVKMAWLMVQDVLDNGSIFFKFSTVKQILSSINIHYFEDVLLI